MFAGLGADGWGADTLARGGRNGIASSVGTDGEEMLGGPCFGGPFTGPVPLCCGCATRNRARLQPEGARAPLRRAPSFGPRFVSLIQAEPMPMRTENEKQLLDARSGGVIPGQRSA